jgi:A/G-specific adenine glycosylase
MSSPVAELKPSIPRFRRDLLAWGRAHRRSFPWRETNDPFRILVAEVLLQRSRGITVAKVYDELFRRWPDPEHLARAREASIAAVIRPLGLVRRAATLRALANEIVAIGEVPPQVERLTQLPGVGRYAAGATLAVAFDEPAPVVDGVTARVYRRYFGSHTELPASADQDLWLLVREASPKRAVREWNWAVLDLASMVCLPKVPKCAECPLRDHCSWASAA